MFLATIQPLQVPGRALCVLPPLWVMFSNQIMHVCDKEFLPGGKFIYLLDYFKWYFLAQRTRGNNVYNKKFVTHKNM